MQKLLKKCRKNKCVTDRPTDQPTNRRTDTVGYRVACTRLKISLVKQNVRCVPLLLLTPPPLLSPPLSLRHPLPLTQRSKICIFVHPETNALRTNQQTNGQKDRCTDQRMDRPSYRDARTHLKRVYSTEQLNEVNVNKCLCVYVLCACVYLYANVSA